MSVGGHNIIKFYAAKFPVTQSLRTRLTQFTKLYFGLHLISKS